MALVDNADKTKFASPYSIDKIVGLFKGNFDAATQTTTLALGYYRYSFPHPFGRPVFCENLISSDNITYYDGNLGLTGAAAVAYSDSTNIYILTNVSSGTIYYKVICSWIDNYDATNPQIEPVLNDVVGDTLFDSRDNIQKIFKQDIGTASTLAADNNITIDHNLGYSPNAKVFYEVNSGEVWPQSGGGTSSFWLYDPAHQSDCYSVITTSQLKINCFLPASGHTTKVWARIYLDAN